MKASLILIVVFLSNFAFAQNTSNRFIEVIGSHKIEILPDEIFLKISIKEFQEDKKIISIESIEKGLIDFITSLNISPKNLSVLNT
ncbi:MAG: hypothetical protein AAGI07_05645, partial [Bacteroidota bacterium]